MQFEGLFWDSMRLVSTTFVLDRGWFSYKAFGNRNYHQVKKKQKNKKSVRVCSFFIADSITCSLVRIEDAVDVMKLRDKIPRNLLFLLWWIRTLCYKVVVFVVMLVWFCL